MTSRSLRTVVEPKDLAVAVPGEGCAETLNALMDAGRWIKQDPLGSDVAVVTWQDGPCVLKRYNHRSWWHSLRTTVKGSRARRCHDTSRRLRRLGVPAPTSIGYVEVYRLGLLWQSYHLAEYVQGPTLSACWQEVDPGDPNALALLQRCAAVLQRLRSQGVSHGDLKHTNLRWVDGEVVLTDLDAVRFHRTGPGARLAARKDLRRFLLDLPADLHKPFQALLASS